MKQKAYCFLTWKSKFAPTGGCGYVTCSFYLIMCLCRQYVAKICKTLHASISTAHKAYLETSVVVGVVKKRRSHQKLCGGMGLASYPGRWEEKNGLVSTVCACAIIPRKLSVKSIRTRPIYFRIIERCSRLLVELLSTP